MIRNRNLITKVLTYKDMVQINNLDRILTRGMIQAEKKIKGDLNKNHQSIELSHRIKYLSYWRLVLSQLLTKFRTSSD